MKTVDIRGEITSNYIGGIYEYARTHDEWFRADYTCPAGVKAVIDSLEDGEELEVIVNSGGGDVMSGQEIYAMLKKASAAGHKTICEIQSLAASAASMIACACDVVRMSSTAWFMIHCASSYAEGNHRDMEHMAKVLSTADEAIAQAYVDKTGASEEQVLRWMNDEDEFWISAKRCVELHFVDEIIRDNNRPITNSMFNTAMPPEMIEKIKNAMEKEKSEKEESEKEKSEKEHPDKEKAEDETAKVAEETEQEAKIAEMKAAVEKVRLFADMTAMGF